MRNSIGIRVKPEAVYYSVVRTGSDYKEITILDQLVLPKALLVPEQLKFIRSTMLDILFENEIESACIRIAESNAKSHDLHRTYLEGVLQELLASSPVIEYHVGRIASISSKLSINRTEFKPLAFGETTYLEIEEWSSWKLEERESVLAAFAASNL